MSLEHHEEGHRCQEFLERLSRYLDDDLEAADRVTIEGHLRDCPCCEDVLESLRHTVEACREQLPPLPPEVRERANARVKELLARRRLVPPAR